MAQVGRAFVADMEPFANEPDTYILTSDADLFPIANIYDLDADTKDVRVTNAHCCDPYNYRRKKIRKSFRNQNFNRFLSSFLVFSSHSSFLCWNEGLDLAHRNELQVDFQKALHVSFTITNEFEFFGYY